MAAIALSALTLKTGVYHNLYAGDTDKSDQKPRFKVGYVTVPNTADPGNTFTVDLFKEFGMRRFLGIGAWIHTTEDSVIVGEEPTTAVDGDILTVTVGGTTAKDKKRVYAIYGL
jgi:hypothetical protein